MTDPIAVPGSSAEQRPAEAGARHAGDTLSAEARRAVAGAAKWWWLLLVAAAMWAVVAVVLLQFTTTSLATVGLIIGAMLLFAGVEQFIVASAAGGMRWLFWIFGAVFVLVGVIALFNPLTTASSVAASLGLILALIGVFWAVESVLARSVNSIWWLGLVSGVILIGLGIWVGNQGLAQKAVSLLLFAGMWALLHAFTDVSRAFQLRRVGQLVARAAA